MSLKPSCKKVAEVLGKELKSRRYTLSTAESCTGGMIGAAITAIPGSSSWFRGGIIAYDNSVKTSQLSVPKEVINEHGAVSAEAVSAMAQGVARKLGTECSIAVSGVAGPDGGTEEKPVGLIFIGIYVKGRTVSYRNVFSGNREQIREQTVETGIRYLTEMIQDERLH